MSSTHNPRESPDVSFAGCGFLGIYHLGVAACLTEHAPTLLDNNKVVGASAGALMAAAMVGGVPLPEMARSILDLAERARRVAPVVISSVFKLDEAINESLEKLLPEDVHLRVSDRVYVAMTTIPEGKQLLANKFSSRSELISALRASSFVPFIANWGFPRFRGHLVCDGILSGVHPKRPAATSTITVSPWAGRASISPSNTALFNRIQSFFFAGWPPSVERIEKLCERGYEDAFKFLIEQKHFSCDGCEYNDRKRCGLDHPTILSPEMKEVFEEAKKEEQRGYDRRYMTKLQDAILHLTLIWLAPINSVQSAVNVVTTIRLPSIETDVFGTPYHCMPLNVRPIS